MFSLPKISATHIIVSVAVLNLIMLFHGEVFRDIPSKHYREGSVGTHISVFLLFMTAVTSFRIFLHRRKQIIWLLIAAGFVFLAADDGFMIHERLDKAFHQYFEMRHTPLTDRIDDMLVALYGLIGAFFLYRSRAEILRYDGFLRYLAVGFGILVMSVILDVLSNDGGIFFWMGFSEAAAAEVGLWLGGIEEVCKLMGGAVFLCGFLHVLRAIQDKTAETGTENRRASASVQTP